MTEGFSIVTSPIFRLSVQRLKAFLAEKYGEPSAAKALTDIKQQIEQHLPSTPEIAPISERLLALGIVDYRQWQLDKHNILFYKVNSQHQTVELLLVMDSRQSLSKLLFELSLLF
ncbi:hypothetical protein [Lacimicrobium alkaliphilum]|uniref:Plasmid stabilization protein n=1 Tax=Lacimicrobium alkaliphilum TaxID=1526571 RepID=A0ABQ1R848_9ALTE|nr:hypothetical protein [Lacimicrobium alkaliphilum]GGD61799.1 hypothetical protein GCM10011357_16330 [Lacimicrobium alkaliphilum]